MTLGTLFKKIFPGNSMTLLRWLGIALLISALLCWTAVLCSCASGSSDDAQEVLAVVQEYLSAVQSGYLDRARGYWTDFNNPGGGWTMVARRDMEHVTQGHMTTFAGGFEIVKSRFELIKGMKKPIGVLKLDVIAQPGGQIKELEIGLVRHEERWYIYSIYPGTW